MRSGGRGLVGAISVLAIGTFVLGSAGGGRAVAQGTDAEATIAAIQTEVAAQQTEVARLQTAAAGETAAAIDGTPTATPSALPAGIPAGSIAGEVTEHVDGDTIKVRTSFRTGTVNLLGVDAPEQASRAANNPPQCFGEEALDHLERMLPVGRDVFLQADEGEDVTGSTSGRFVWFLGKKDNKPYLANALMIERGFAAYQTTRSNVEQLMAAEESAKDDEAGLWAECGGPHVRITPTPVPPTRTPAPTPTPDPVAVRAAYEVLADVRELAIRPGNLIGDKIAFSGVVFTIQVAPPGDLFLLEPVVDLVCWRHGNANPHARPDRRERR